MAENHSDRDPDASVLKTGCEEHKRLAKEAYGILKKLHELTDQQMDAFEAGDHERFMKYDREVETTLGEKERMVGRLRQHDEEHGCMGNRPAG